MEVTKPLTKLYHKHGDNGFTLNESIEVIGDDATSYIDIYISAGVLKKIKDKYFLTQDGKNATIGIDHG